MEHVRPLLRHNWQIIAATFTGGLAVILAAFAWLIWTGYQHAQHQAEIVLDDIVRTVSSTVETTVSRTEGDLDVLAVQIAAQTALGGGRRADIETQMKLHLRTFGGATAYGAFDAEGRPVFEARRHDMGAFAAIANKDWFETLRADPRRNVVVSPLFPAQEGFPPTFLIAVPMRTADGAFQGAMAAAVDILPLQSAIDSLQTGPHGLITLRNLEDDSILLRSPSPPGLIGKTSQGAAVAARIFSGNPSGEGEMVFPSDGITRRYVFRTLPEYNLGMVAALAPQDYLAPWRHQSLWTGILMVVLAAGLTALFIGQIKAQTDLRAFTQMLSRSEDRFRSLIEGTTDWVWETDANHRLIWTSDSVTGIFDLPVDYFVGKRREDIASAQREADMSEWKRYRSLMDKRQSFRDFRYWLNDGKGKPRWISVSGSPCFDADGFFLGYRGSGSDVTAQYETASQLRLLSDVVERSPISVVITSERSVIQYANAQASRQSGYDPAEMIGKPVSILDSGDPASPAADAMRHALITAAAWSGDLESRHKSGKMIWEHVSLNFIRDDYGIVRHHVWLREDISARKASEIQLLSANRALDAQAETLKSVNAELEQFAYVASHDLRQPLRMISSYLELIREELEGTLSEQLRTYFAHAVNGAKRMDRLILDLLEYSRTGRDMVLEPVAVAVAVEHAVQNLQAAIAETHADIRIARDLPDVAGRLTEITRLFQNLIGNAIKYHAPDRPPVIEIGWSPHVPDRPAPAIDPETGTPDTGAPSREQEQRLFWVKDNGIGIDPKNFERIFRVFQRCVAPDSYEGSGIGLAICKKIVDQLHGRIWVDSEPGTGATFFVTLPKGPMS